MEALAFSYWKMRLEDNLQRKNYRGHHAAENKRQNIRIDQEEELSLWETPCCVGLKPKYVVKTHGLARYAVSLEHRLET